MSVDPTELRRPRRRERFVMLCVSVAWAVAIGCTDPSAPPVPVPTSLEAIGEQDQVGALGAPLPEELAARVLDADREPMPDVEVQWAIAEGDGSLSAPTTRTDDEGIARVTWTLGTRLDVQHRVTARLDPLGPIEWTASAVIPSGAALTPVVGMNQEAIVGATLAQPLQVRLTLVDGRPVRSATISWSVASGGGVIQSADQTTDGDGRASASVSLGQTTGAQTFRASITGGPSADFTATARPAPPLVLATEVIVPVSAGLNPVYVTAVPGDDRIFIADFRGSIHVLRNGQVDPTPLLDIRDLVLVHNEQGFLSVALHPTFASNGHLYVNYTDRSGNTVIERYTLQQGAQTIDRASVKRLLYILQPFPNHNGGLMKFGPDGYLYIGMGDGGGGGDPYGNGQNLGTLHGKMLRIDVNSGDPYAIPPGNPFVGRAGARPEIWALGLRNPWRWSFDRVAGMLYIADVGQGRYEEVNAVPWQSAGVNYGWVTMEGAHCYNDVPCDPTGLTLPVHEYDHSQGCSIIGGYVYRGTRMPQLVGHYVYADLCRTWIRAFRLENGVAVEHREWNLGDIGAILSFGEDTAGELYIATSNLEVRRLTRAP